MKEALALGLPLEELPSFEASNKEAPLIWPDMVPAWRIFLGMATQWKMTAVGMSGSIRTGLDYAVLEPVARGLGLDYPLPSEVFADLRLMEAEALSVWSKRRG